ncbi:hypothetical protein BOTBODRAFT_102384 [Botryobasidium botryosum FD-172 SS1]|uniref:Ubiquinone biosynthesis O-methyltransferase, mitochondrial n=1 Tax=Botryobasidium botryosum (strain FD-172 SS1) TaxID=930990 RepID=A0A067N5M1_BOTB1|nr:hypothetical protein BOTBODRAFT_102384 [Botryobasidium botryosum FD-172 SS1]
MQSLLKSSARVPSTLLRAFSTTKPLLLSSTRKVTSQAHAEPLSSVNASEIAHFSRLSSQWWDERGEFALLHRMNPPRVQFIRDKILEFKREEATARGEDSIDEGKGVLKGWGALDVGCGGGLLSESLARLGARTLAIDASESNINIASLHSSADPHLASTLAYRCIAAEDLLAGDSPKKQYDVVCSMEVLEHVDNPSAFLRTLGELVKPGGHLFLSTIARTPLAHLLTITMAEDVLRFVTSGTHHYSKFINPEELIDFFRSDLRWFSGEPTRKEAEVRGIIYLPWRSEWVVPPRGTPGVTSCNYLFWARKPLEGRLQ